MQVRVYANRHAVIHPDLPNIPNMGYSIAGRFFYPGDAFTVPAEPVEILGLPVAGVWMKLSEAIDYLREVSPRVALPVHDHQDVWLEMACGLLRELGPASTSVTAPNPSEFIEI